MNMHWVLSGVGTGVSALAGALAELGLRALGFNPVTIAAEGIIGSITGGVGADYVF